MAQGVDERRRAPRTQLAVGCTLRRRHGSPISCRTVEVGAGGMSVESRRPLAEDELLQFDLPLAGEPELCGEARVLRQQAHQVYALRFEHLGDAMRARIERFARA
jgi:hypothetical protein